MVTEYMLVLILSSGYGMSQSIKNVRSMESCQIQGTTWVNNWRDEKVQRRFNKRGVIADYKCFKNLYENGALDG